MEKTDIVANVEKTVSILFSISNSLNDSVSDVDRANINVGATGKELALAVPFPATIFVNVRIFETLCRLHDGIISKRTLHTQYLVELDSLYNCQV